MFKARSREIFITDVGGWQLITSAWPILIRRTSLKTVLLHPSSLVGSTSLTLMLGLGRRM
jgi:hypothetical protein